jgi:hypothetical protein
MSGFAVFIIVVGVIALVAGLASAGGRSHDPAVRASRRAARQQRGRRLDAGGHGMGWSNGSYSTPDSGSSGSGDCGPSGGDSGGGFSGFGGGDSGGGFSGGGDSGGGSSC